jgi:hypothetical protein
MKVPNPEDRGKKEEPIALYVGVIVAPLTV